MISLPSSSECHNIDNKQLLGLDADRNSSLEVKWEFGRPRA